MDNTLVSIITPAYNSSLYIESTIQSILAQTYTNWELLITDDCSTDDTIKIIEHYTKQDLRIKLFKLRENSGAGVARNFSIQQARGRYIAFCDSDDRWMPDKLEKQIAFMEKKKCPFSYTSYYAVNQKNGSVQKMVCPEKIGYYYLLRDSIGCLTVMYDVMKVGKVYMPALRKRQDWALWLIIIQKCKIAYGLREFLAIYNERNDSISSGKLKLVPYNLMVYRKVLHYSRWRAYFLFMFWFMPSYLLKKLKGKLSEDKRL